MWYAFFFIPCGNTTDIINKRISVHTHMNMEACSSTPFLMLHHLPAENLHMWFWLEIPLYYASTRQLYVFSISVLLRLEFYTEIYRFNTIITPTILQYQASWIGYTTNLRCSSRFIIQTKNIIMTYFHIDHVLDM